MAIYDFEEKETKVKVIGGKLLIVVLTIVGLIIVFGNIIEKAKSNNNSQEIVKAEKVSTLYQNQITSEELSKNIEQINDLFVYFFSPECHYCEQTAEIVEPLTKKMGVELKELNLLDYPLLSQDYTIEKIPTIIHFVDGKEVNRLVGLQDTTEINKWFEKESRGSN
ncbi:MAG: thioredoxin family protein [Tepidibacillus sp.]